MHLIHDIILGIHQLAEDVEKMERHELEDTDYTTTKTHQMNSDGRVFTMKDYAPLAFGKIRKMCGVKTKEYLKSWSLPKDTSKMEESAGRSGSLFYRTEDKKFFFKTILHPEVGTLVAALKDYLQHLESHPKMFIMRLLGLHRISYESGGSGKVWILVLGNVFPPKVTFDEIYDLKGRKPKKGKSFQERGRKTPANNPRKDNEINRKFEFVVEDQKKFYLDQLGSDVEFLRRNNLMDYSLLVGVHRLTPEELAASQNGSSSSTAHVEEVADEEEPKSSRKSKKGKKADEETEQATSSSSKKNKKSKKGHHANAPAVFSLQDYLAMGALQGRSRDMQGKSETDLPCDEVYFVGVIDCLTSYVLKKKVAFMFKQVMWSKSTLSTVDADYYAKRFLTFMQGPLLYHPEEAAAAEKPKKDGKGNKTPKKGDVKDKSESEDAPSVSASDDPDKSEDNLADKMARGVNDSVSTSSESEEEEEDPKKARKSSKTDVKSSKGEETPNKSAKSNGAESARKDSSRKTAAEPSPKKKKVSKEDSASEHSSEDEKKKPVEKASKKSKPAAKEEESSEAEQSSEEAPKKPQKSSTKSKAAEPPKEESNEEPSSSEEKPKPKKKSSKRDN